MWALVSNRLVSSTYVFNRWLLALTVTLAAVGKGG